jgi:hypothetical protein
MVPVRAIEEKEKTSIERKIRNHFIFKFNLVIELFIEGRQPLANKKKK